LKLEKNNMWENASQGRKSQRNAAVLAVCILLGLLLMFPIGGGFGDWLNEINAPDSASTRYAEVSTSFDMDSAAFIASGTYKSYYMWKNSTGVLNYNNVSHTAGVISVTNLCPGGETSIISNFTAGTSNVSWAMMKPYFSIYFGYSARNAYDDNVVLCRLRLASIYVSANAYARTITLSAADQVFYTVTQAQTDSDTYIDVNVSFNVNDLRRAIIAGGAESYFKLKVTAMDTSLSIASSGMFAYNVTRLTGRDDALFFIGALACALTLVGVPLVQPRYSLPFGGGKKGGKY